MSILRDIKLEVAKELLLKLGYEQQEEEEWNGADNAFCVINTIGSDGDQGPYLRIITVTHNSIRLVSFP